MPETGGCGHCRRRCSYLRAASNRKSQQPLGQQQSASDEQSRKDADEKAWTEAVSAGTAAAFNGYIQNFSVGAHCVRGA